MAGLKDKRGFIDKDRLDLSERQAVEYWMKRWGVKREQLTAAHRKVGRMVKDIAAGSIELHVAEDELARRRAEPQRPLNPAPPGWLTLYRDDVQPMSCGAVLSPNRR